MLCLHFYEWIIILDQIKVLLNPSGHLPEDDRCSGKAWTSCLSALSGEVTSSWHDKVWVLHNLLLSSVSLENPIRWSNSTKSHSEELPFNDSNQPFWSQHGSKNWGGGRGEWGTWLCPAASRKHALPTTHWKGNYKSNLVAPRPLVNKC